MVFFLNGRTPFFSDKQTNEEISTAGRGREKL